MACKIFLSYRRDDTAGFARALFRELRESFPAESLFMDVGGGIAAGQDFVRVIEQQVRACDVMLVLIGPNWLTAKDETGRPRLENPGDFVRIEVASALKLGKHVIPLLFEKTVMPQGEALPRPLKALARRNAVGLRHERFEDDGQGLIKVLEEALAEVEAARRLAETEAPAAKAQSATEQAAKAAKAARAENEQASLDAIAGLSPEQIARFEALVWAGIPQPTDINALKGFLAEFPNGAHASEANARLTELEAAREAAKREKGEMDARASTSAAGTVAALKVFRRDSPQSKYADAERMRTETGVDSHLRRAYQRGRLCRVLARGPQCALEQRRQDAQALGGRDRKKDPHLRGAFRANLFGGFLARRPNGALRRRG
jgi:hypothetical protein